MPIIKFSLLSSQLYRLSGAIPANRAFTGTFSPALSRQRQHRVTDSISLAVLHPDRLPSPASCPSRSPWCRGRGVSSESSGTVPGSRDSESRSPRNSESVRAQPPPCAQRPGTRRRRPRPRSRAAPRRAAPLAERPASATPLCPAVCPCPRRAGGPCGGAAGGASPTRDAGRASESQLSTAAAVAESRRAGPAAMR